MNESKGLHVSAKTKRYVVSIAFREPTFERHTGGGPKVMKGTFVVFARTEEAAAGDAVQEFRRIEALSGVGWPREIESIAVFPKAIDGGRG